MAKFWQIKNASEIFSILSIKDWVGVRVGGWVGHSISSYGVFELKNSSSAQLYHVSILRHLYQNLRKFKFY